MTALIVNIKLIVFWWMALLVFLSTLQRRVNNTFKWATKSDYFGVKEVIAACPLWNNFRFFALSYNLNVKPLQSVLQVRQNETKWLKKVKIMESFFIKESFQTWPKKSNWLCHPNFLICRLIQRFWGLIANSVPFFSPGPWKKTNHCSRISRYDLVRSVDLLMLLQNQKVYLVRNKGCDCETWIILALLLWNRCNRCNRCKSKAKLKMPPSCSYLVIHCTSLLIIFAWLRGLNHFSLQLFVT